MSIQSVANAYFPSQQVLLQQVEPIPEQDDEQQESGDNSADISAEEKQLQMNQLYLHKQLA